ncbi:MAG TPA: methyl-accepting chemotaxis protein [Accumulibacter sp.]|nr:methyl-accepting chemotaxis protein [Accumulibacter sp.]
MKSLGLWRVSRRIQILVGLSMVGLLLLSVTASFQLRDTMLEDRKAKVKNLVEYAVTQLAYYEQEAKAGRMTLEQAQKSAKDSLRAARYGNNDYFWINDHQPRSVMHPLKPEIEGKNVSGNKDATGKLLYIEFVNVVKTQGAGFVDYQWVRKPGEPGFPKISYVRGFEPWGWIVGTGIYIDDVDTQFQHEMLLLGGISLVLLILLGFMGWLLGRGVLRQLGGEPVETVEIMRRIAGGDLTVSIDKPIPASMMETVNTMVSSLRELVQKINGSVQQVVSSSEHIGAASRDIAEAAGQQADATSSMAASLEELTVTSQVIADTASDTEKNARDSMRLAGEGSDRVGQATAAVSKISSTVSDVSSRIHLLENRIQEVSSIAATIKDIAGQTNLLALNAAIEAARAGEQGRGFAVVADEVRKLAERTAQATTGIEEMVNSIQSDTVSAVEAMNNALPDVEKGVQLTGEAAESLNEIKSGSDQTLRRVSEITTATQEQSLAATSITQRVEEMAQMVEQTAATIRSTATTTTQLEQVAHDLQTQVNRFRI